MYNLSFLDKNGLVHLILSEKSLFFLALKHEEEIVKMFHKKPDKCIITAN